MSAYKNERITATGLSYELPDGRILFSNLNLSLGSGLTALVGPNGVGKTTLARLLTGDLQPLRGRLHRTVPVTFFAQRETPEPVTVQDFLGTEYGWTQQGEKLLAGIDRESLCTALSGGQWMRARLARALNQGYLILDEPTNDIDRAGREIVLRFLREHNGGILLISHDRECLALCDETLELSNRGLTKYGGGWEAYSAARDHERESLAQALESAEKARDKALAVRNERREKQDKRNRRGADAAAKGGQAKILLGARKRAAQATTGKVDTETVHKVGEAARSLHRALQEVKVDPLMYADLEGQPLPAQKLIAEAAAFNVRYSGSLRWVYPHDLEFTWRGNIRMVLKGGNGSGKSTLLNALLAKLPESTQVRGSLSVGKVKTLYLDQRGAGLEEDKSVFDNIRAVCSASDAEIRNKLAGFLFTREAAFQPVRTLSGGERLRAALARGFLGESEGLSTVPDLLVLDEPTNNLDLANIAFLEKVIAGFRGAIIVISHDEAFIENCHLKERIELD
jgi:ATPase subunit of ABC transporter with duplicated ATPase domains